MCMSDIMTATDSQNSIASDDELMIKVRGVIINCFIGCFIGRLFVCLFVCLRERERERES